LSASKGCEDLLGRHFLPIIGEISNDSIVLGWHPNVVGVFLLCRVSFKVGITYKIPVHFGKLFGIVSFHCAVCCRLQSKGGWYFRECEKYLAAYLWWREASECLVKSPGLFRPNKIKNLTRAIYSR
jgi:hypothetical protein